MKEGISITIGSCTFVFMLFLIMGNIPDSYKIGGVYFDKYPLWIHFVFVTGVVANSALIAFIIGSAIYAILEHEYIKMWIKERIKRYKNRNTYKFNNNIREEKRKPIIMF